MAHSSRGSPRHEERRVMTRHFWIGLVAYSALAGFAGALLFAVYEAFR